MFRCCICGETHDGYGNNPHPYFADRDDLRCCDECNTFHVLTARVILARGDKKKAEGHVKAIEHLAKVKGYV